MHGCNTNKMRRRCTSPAVKAENHEITPHSITSSSDINWISAWLTPVSNLLLPNPNLIWNSRDFAPAWVGIDLGAVHEVSCVGLLPCMDPPSGRVVHVIRAGQTREGMRRVRTYEGDTEDSVWLSIPIQKPARYIEISTVLSPSWVAWRRVVVCRPSSTED